MHLVECRRLRDFLALRWVRLPREQRRFRTNILLTVLQSRHPAVTTFTIHRSPDEPKPIGYVMLVHANEPTQWIIERLTIDREHQRQGYAYAVADQLIDEIHSFENSEMVVARYHPDNDAARQLFAKLGFKEREKRMRGQVVALLEFEFEDEEDATPSEDDSPKPPAAPDSAET